MYALSSLKTVNRILCLFSLCVQLNQCFANASLQQDTMNEVILLPRHTVAACPGERVTFMCVTNETSVTWNVTVPTGENLEQPVSRQGPKELLNITSDSSLIFSNFSTFESVHFSLVITNVTNKLNNTKVKCYRCSDFQAVTTLLVRDIGSGNDVYPLPLQYNITKEFMANGVSVYLEWEEEAGVTYTTNVFPPSPLTLGRGSIQVMLSYNTIYSVNITSTLCEQTSITNTTDFNYVKCFDTFNEVMVHSADRDVFFFDGTNITLTCPLGKILTGHNTSTCIHGEWEPSLNNTECKTDCGVPPKKSNIGLKFNSTLQGSELIIWCDESPNDTETLTAICLSDGTWSVNLNHYSCSLQPGANILILPLVTTSGTVILLIIVTVLVVTFTVIIRTRGWSSLRKLQRARGADLSVHEYQVTSHQSARLPESEYSLVHHHSTSEEVQANSDMNYDDERPNSGRNNLVYADITPRFLKSQPGTSKLVDDENYKVEYAQLNHNHHGGANVQKQTVEIQTQQDVGEPDSLLNLDSLLIQLRPHVTTTWYAFGEAIGVEKKVLEECLEYSPEQSLIEVLDKWLRINEHPTWKKIAEALKRIGLQKLGLDIERVYDTGKLPIQIDMNRVPQTMLTDLEEELPPPVPPRCTEYI